MILRAYIDDSDINQEPISILGGWIAPAGSWVAFADEWQRGLDMKPKLRYFKMSECMGFGGEFAGWSEEARDHRLRYFVKLIEEYKLLAIGGVIRTAEYREIFRNSPAKTFDVPYYLMFFGLMAGLATSFADIQEAIATKADKVDFVFDCQPGQMEKVLGSWSYFKETAPDHIRPLFGELPIFRDDKTTLPLQAADLYAWHLRSQETAAFNGQAYRSPWGNAGDAIDTANWIWNVQNLEVTRAALDEPNLPGHPVGIWPKSA